MALNPRPDWTPIPDPPGPDPATAMDFQALAGEHLPDLDAADTLLGADMLAVDTARSESDAATVSLGLTWAAELDRLKSYVDEEAPDNLLAALTRAAEQDAALDTVAGEVATALGG